MLKQRNLMLICKNKFCDIVQFNKDNLKTSLKYQIVKKYFKILSNKMIWKNMGFQN